MTYAPTQVLSASKTDDTVAWHENDGSESFTQHVVTTLADWVAGSSPSRGRRRRRACSASYADDKIAWYMNDGSQNFRELVIANTADEAWDDDDTVAWYENDGFQAFTERIITTLADGARSVYAIDVDGDGEIDVLSASENDDTAAWFENDGSQDFTEHIITDHSDTIFEVFAIDVDGDGDVDALTASQGDHLVAWHENGCAGPAPTTAPTMSPPTTSPAPTALGSCLCGAGASFDADLQASTDRGGAVIGDSVSGAALAPGGVVSAAAGAVRAGCVPGERCDCYAYSAGSVKVAAPAAAAPPGAVVTGPSTASACEALVLHSDSSTGSGGRAWASIAWNVTWDDGGGFEAEGDALEFAADQLAAAADRGVRQRPVAARFWVKTIENRHGDAW
ncbi:hypothetical protein JL721_11555 [Aureococcus anophagefferens]|nr:hypothetical protein JL721_11555 [Aureococcus anophagefferens]